MMATHVAFALILVVWLMMPCLLPNDAKVRSIRPKNPPTRLAR